MKKQDSISSFSVLAGIISEIRSMRPPTPDDIANLKKDIDKVFRNASDDACKLMESYEHDVEFLLRTE